MYYIYMYIYITCISYLNHPNICQLFIDEPFGAI